MKKENSTFEFRGAMRRMRTPGLTLLGCAVGVGVTWAWGWLVVDVGVHNLRPVYHWLERWCYRAPFGLGESLCIALFGAVVFSPGLWASQRVILACGPQRGRMGLKLGAALSVAAAGMMSVMACLTDPVTRMVGWHAGDTFGWIFLGSWAVLWSAWWAWDVARREKAPAVDSPRAPE